MDNNNPNITNMTKAITTIIGNPSQFILPNCLRAKGARIAYPLDTLKAIPRAIKLVPKVNTNGVSPSFATERPLIIPKTKPMPKKQKKIEERIEKIESVLYRKLQNKDIPADISLPEDATYLNLNCGKCKEFLGSLTISDNSYYLTNFYNRYCPRCGNKTIID